MANGRLLTAEEIERLATTEPLPARQVIDRCLELWDADLDRGHAKPLEVMMVRSLDRTEVTVAEMTELRVALLRECRRQGQRLTRSLA